MWFLILQDIDGEREVWHTEYESRSAALAMIKDVVVMRPNTMRVYVCKVNDSFATKLSVRLFDIDGSEVE